MWFSFVYKAENKEKIQMPVGKMWFVWVSKHIWFIFACEYMTADDKCILAPTNQSISKEWDLKNVESFPGKNTHNTFKHHIKTLILPKPPT